jgi:hypothetical protein
VLLASCELGLLDVAVPMNAARDCDLPTLLLGVKAEAVSGSKQMAAPMDQRFNIIFVFLYTTSGRRYKTRLTVYKATSNVRQDVSRNGRRTLARASVMQMPTTTKNKDFIGHHHRGDKFENLNVTLKMGFRSLAPKILVD